MMLSVIEIENNKQTKNNKIISFHRSNIDLNQLEDTQDIFDHIDNKTREWETWNGCRRNRRRDVLQVIVYNEAIA